MKKILVFLVVAAMLTIGTFAAFEKVNTYNNNFSDVKDTNWFAENVKTAYELGFMNGKSDTLFDPNGSVTVVEGITMASRLNAIYNGIDIENYVKEDAIYRLDFDDPAYASSANPSLATTEKVAVFDRATGVIDDGMLILTAGDPNDKGNYDPQARFLNLEFPARDYNKMTVRMRCDPLPNVNPDAPRDKTAQIFFTTYDEVKFAEDKSVYVNLSSAGDMTEWFDVVVDFSKHAKWTGTIKDVRFDPTNNNGVYYFDYVIFSKDTSGGSGKWYDKYIDYATDKGIISSDTFAVEEYSRNITRAEMCDLFASALPEEYFTPINDIKGIPDVLRDFKNADVYLMLYKAGVLLGDTNGNFNPSADIKRSEVAAIINRVAIPENRVKGTVDADWSKQGNEYDIEFDNDSYLTSLEYTEVDSFEIKDGALILKPRDRGPNERPQYDPRITARNINIDASKYSKLKVRMKMEFIGEVDNTQFDFFFMTGDDTRFTEVKSLHQDFVEYSYLDPAGWYVMELDFTFNPEWKDTITAFRFDPANVNGIYTIDYIRLAPSDPLYNASHEALIAEGYTAERLLQDEGFERGFYVPKFDQSKMFLDHGIFRDYCETDEKPLWGIAPWWSMYDLWENRDTTTDKYTLKDDKGINTVIYNPEEKSISMRVDATKVHEGKPHISNTETWWPHLLIEQNRTFCDFDKVKNSAAADKIFVEADIRLTDYKHTTNPEGENAAGYYIYFYLESDKAPGQKIWFGLEFLGELDASKYSDPVWAPDGAGNQMIYRIRKAAIFNGIENSFNPEPGVALVSDEWKHMRIDVTSHIERAIEWANRDNSFGVPVTVEDMYFSGVNIGFEVWGNIDCTFEFKNLNMISYNKD